MRNVLISVCVVFGFSACVASQDEVVADLTQSSLSIPAPAPAGGSTAELRPFFGTVSVAVTNLTEVGFQLGCNLRSANPALNVMGPGTMVPPWKSIISNCPQRAAWEQRWEITVGGFAIPIEAFGENPNGTAHVEVEFNDDKIYLFKVRRQQQMLEPDLSIPIATRYFIEIGNPNAVPKANPPFGLLPGL